MKVLIPPPGSGLPCPPMPSVVLPLLARSRPPFLRRSGRRSCCVGGDPDGDATIVAKKSPAVFLDVFKLLVTTSAAHHPDRLPLLQQISLTLEGPPPPWPASQ